MLTHKIDSAITVKLLDEQYAEAIFEVVENNREQFFPWFDWVESTHSVRSVLEFIRGARKQFGEREGVYWLVFYKKKLVGQVFLLFVNHIDRSAEIGFWLDHTVTGKGIITKACDAMLQFAFKEWNLHRISLNADIENLPSQAVADRLGFVYEGTKRESELINKQYRSIKQYSLLKREYKPLQK